MDFKQAVIHWFWFAIFFAMMLRGYARYSKLDNKNEEEGRVFGSGMWQITTVLLLPWAIRQAEKDYINEQKDDRQSAQ